METYVIGGTFAVILVAIGGYFLARFMKGSVDLELARSAADSGQALTGQAKLTAKRPIRGLLRVSLVGRDKRRRRRSGNKDRIEWVEVYRHDQVLQETRDLPAGTSQVYSFEITAPTAAEARRGGSVARELAAEVGEGAMASVLKVAASAADVMQGRIYWHVEAVLEADGVDLSTKRKVAINLQD